MPKKIGRRSIRKSKPTYVNSILMVSLVLFILGILGTISLFYNSLSSYIKKQVPIEIYLDDNIKEVDARKLAKRLEVEPFVEYTSFISKEDALEKYLSEDENDESDFNSELLDFNPLPASVQLFINPDYMNADSILAVEYLLTKKYEINQADIKSEKRVIARVDDNLKMIGYVLLGVCVLLLFTTIVLIDSATRLAMYSNRFLVKSMQMVGASKWFISKPYMIRALVNGLTAGVIAVGGLIMLVYAATDQLPALEVIQNPFQLGVLFMGLIGIGMFISWWSTSKAVNKYLRTQLEDLY